MKSERNLTESIEPKETHEALPALLTASAKDREGYSANNDSPDPKFEIRCSKTSNLGPSLVSLRYPAQSQDDFPRMIAGRGLGQSA